LAEKKKDVSEKEDSENKGVNLNNKDFDLQGPEELVKKT
jgi:hypothetical protein